MMNSLSNKKLIIISLVSLFIAALVFYFSFKNISSVSSELKFAKKNISKVKSQINNKKSNISSLDEKIAGLTSQKSKVEKLEEELDSVDFNRDTSENIKYFNDLKLKTLSVNLNEMRTADSGADTAASDLLISSLLFADSYYSSISEKIVENNNRMNKIIGQLSYNKNSDNSLLKLKLYNNIPKSYLNNKLDEENVNFAKSLVFLKKSFLNTYVVSLENPNIGSFVANNSEVENESNIFSGKSVTKDSNIYHKLIDIYVFLLDTYAQNKDALYDIESSQVNDDDFLNALMIRDGSKVIRIEKEDADANYEYFYYDFFGNILYSLDASDFNGKYYDINNIDDDYRQALNLLSKF